MSPAHDSSARGGRAIWAGRHCKIGVVAFGVAVILTAVSVANTPAPTAGGVWFVFAVATIACVGGAWYLDFCGRFAWRHSTACLTGTIRERLRHVGRLLFRYYLWVTTVACLPVTFGLVAWVSIPSFREFVAFTVQNPITLVAEGGNGFLVQSALAGVVALVVLLFCAVTLPYLLFAVFLLAQMLLRLIRPETAPAIPSASRSPSHPPA